MSYPTGGLQTPFVGSTELLAAQLNKILDAFNAMFPLGAVLWLDGYSGTTTENLINGIWLERNGVAISRTTYADLNTLYSGAGYPFGSGDGSTTFNLAPASGRAMVHHPGSTGHADVKTLGATDGNAIGARSPKHAHSLSLSAPAHTHTITDPGHTHSGRSSGGGSALDGSGGGVIFTTGSATTGISVNSGGGGSVSGSVGLSGRGTDTVAFLVAGISVVKAFA